MKKTIVLAVIVALASLLTGCSGSSSSPAPPPVPVTVSVSPPSATIQTGSTLQFSASVTNTSNTAVTWQVNGTAGGSSSAGTITSGGLYTAPASVPNPDSVTVTAVSQADTSASGSATVTIEATPAALSITPRTVTVLAAATQQFTLTVSGSSTVPAVNWQVNGTTGGTSTAGTISTGGLYTAPANPPSGQKVTVTAVSQSDANETASATVTVAPSLATLNGQYAFLFSGQNGQGNLQEAGSFTADGKGNLTNGLEDINSGAGVFTTEPFTGTYTVGTDGRGSLTITPSAAALNPETFSLVLITNASAQLIRFDSLATGAGSLDLQDPSAFNNSALSGNYILSLDDLTGSAGAVAALPPLVGLGLLNLSGSGAVLSNTSLLNVNNNGTASLNVPVSTGSYSVGTIGRGTMTLSSNLGVFDFAFYVISHQKVRLVSTDATPVWAGSLNAQQGSGGFTNSSLQGYQVFAATGVSTAGQVADAGTFLPSNGSVANGVADENSNGVLTPGYTFTGSYSINSTGRGSLQMVNNTLGTANYAFYMQSGSQAVLMRTDFSAVTLGSLFTQSSSVVSSLTAVNGPFGFTLDGVSSTGSIDKLGQFTANGLGAASGAEDVNNVGVLNPDLALTATYTVGSVGHGVMNITAGGGTRILHFYLVTPKQMELIGMDTDQVLLGEADGQFP